MSICSLFFVAMALTREVLEELLDKKLAPLQASLDFLNEKYDIILKKVSDQEVKVKELSKENSRLHSEVGLLRSTLSNQGKWLNDLEQYGRRECLEIRGIPEVKGEDTSQIACQVANLIGVKLSRQDISTSHRIKPKNSTAKFPPSIIVKFTSRDKRDETYKARGRLRELSTHNVPGLDRFKSNSIYLSESLTQRNKALFKSALEDRKQMKYDFIWTANGNIYLRKNERSPSIHVTDESVLINLRSSSFVHEVEGATAMTDTNISSKSDSAASTNTAS